MLDAGVEPVLRSAGLLQDALDEAYGMRLVVASMVRHTFTSHNKQYFFYKLGALRDLECDVQMVKFSSDGTVEAAVEHFGTGKKSAFSAVYDEAPDISRRIETDAHAPFANGGMFDNSMDHHHTHDHSGKCCDETGGV
jgi:hypothetical protein